MTPDNHAIVRRFWSTANAANWDAFAALLSPDLVYEVPQTRERISGREGLVEFFRTWPGAWWAEVVKTVADAHSAVTVINFVTPTEQMTGITFFELREGTITRLTDYWPSDYDPPERASAVVQRY